MPGHSEDSTLLYSESGGYAFSGDTVFQGAVGATHFPGGDDEKLASSIRDRVLTLPPDTKFYPGTGTDSAYPVKFRCCAVSRD